MNRTLLPSYLVILIALSIASQAAKAINYTFDVDSSSGIGSGFFSIDLPDAWPGNIGHSTIIEASSFHGFLDAGDRWVSLSVSLNEPIESPDNAVLFGASRALSFFSAVRSGIGLDPVTAVDDIPGVTLRTIAVPDHGITALFLAVSVLVLLFLRRHLSHFIWRLFNQPPWTWAPLETRNLFSRCPLPSGQSPRLIFVDGAEGPKFDEIVAPTATTVDPRSIVEAQRAAALAGQQAPDLQSRPVVFSKDGKRCSYVGLQNQEWVLMVDGKEMMRLPSEGVVSRATIAGPSGTVNLLLEFTGEDGKHPMFARSVFGLWCSWGSSAS